MQAPQGGRGQAECRRRTPIDPVIPPRRKELLGQVFVGCQHFLPLVDASAAKDEDYLLTMLDSDPGARRLGEFAFGTNFGITQFTKQILLDEKIGGTIHMALGAGYPDSGSTNQSAIHWDMICDIRQGGTVTVDGEPFLVNGKFLI